MAIQLLEGEREWLSTIVSNLSDHEAKLVYADWLEDRSDARSDFLRAFAHAAGTMRHADFPKPKKLSEEWLDLIGFRLLERIAKEESFELTEPILKLARPALRMKKSAKTIKTIEVGASRIGGMPDLPKDFPWPKGDDCPAIYNDDTAGAQKLAGFLAQINLEETAQTEAGRQLPDQGILSFFCYQDFENDNPDVIGVGAFHFPRGVIAHPH